MGISASITQTDVIVGSPGSYEWQGYSVIQARRLLSEDDVTIVTGAPKDSREDARGSVLLAVKQKDQLIVQQTLRGEQTGSYFGNVVTTTDLNNDGWNDLLVGAPFYFHRQQEAGGAVYVYMNSGGRFDSGPSVVLRGPARSAFGMSVSAAGDLNQDGFQDFAVGAPFHETGSVMIWTGSSEGVSTEPSQTCPHGTDVSSRCRRVLMMQTCSHDSDVSSRCRRVLKVQTCPHGTDVSSRCRRVLMMQTCSHDSDVSSRCRRVLMVQTCPHDVDVSSRYRRVLTVQTCPHDVDMSSQRRRVLTTQTCPHDVDVSLRCRRVLTMQTCSHDADVSSRCRRVLIIPPPWLCAGLDVDGNQYPDLLVGSLDDTVALLRTRPVVHLNKTLRVSPDVVDSNSCDFCTGEKKDRDNITVHFTVAADITSLKSRLRFHDNRQSVYSGYLSMPTRRCKSLRVGLLIHIQKACGSDNCCHSNLQMTAQFTDENQNPFSRATPPQQSVLSTTRFFCVNWGTRSKATRRTSSPGPASFSGHVTGESAMRKTEDVGSLLLFTFQVHIDGKPLGHLGNLEVEFKWPRVVSNGKWLLYLTDIQIHGASEPRCNPPGNIINTLRLVLSKEETKRGRRSLDEEEADAEEELEEQSENTVLHLQGQKKKSYTLDCVHGAECVTFVCPLINMSDSATLTIKARLWNSTLLEDYSDAKSVLVRGRATLKLQTNKPTINMETHSTEIEVHIYPDSGQQVVSSAPLWIIVVSVMAGVLLLGLISLLLWKCGFFVRRAAALHQGRILGKHKLQPYTDSDGFLIQDRPPSSRNRKSPKHWLTSWTESH
ncbi:hypothetical protein F2P81_025489 [Scophthalmus maximus]|uniref:Integrin alpha third immunoglobulin-like domain-containing protein n=1 Tax=Scophthalmus maximus TaxID=52904 RepID=A0A6A4RK68_SCOMX|nr:hypothetical protein F2P81_025489 [Scophthalmus maximus]